MDAATERPRILLVEDDALTRKFFAAVIRDRLPDADILEASTVQQARAKIDRGTQLVITDIHLGDGNGVEVLAAVRASPSAAARVLAVTGLSGAEADDLLLQGFDAVLLKPVNMAALRDVLAHVFARPSNRPSDGGST